MSHHRGHRGTEGIEEAKEQNVASITSIKVYANHPEQVKDELAVLGVTFEPLHRRDSIYLYAYKRDKVCLELHQASKANPPTENELVLTVSSLDQAIEAAKSVHAEIKSGPSRSPWADTAELRLPSDIKVTLIDAH